MGKQVCAILLPVALVAAATVSDQQAVPQEHLDKVLQEVMVVVTLWVALVAAVAVLHPQAGMAAQILQTEAMVVKACCLPLMAPLDITELVVAAAVLTALDQLFLVVRGVVFLGLESEAVLLVHPH
jgi:hypothetical protein